MPESKDLPSSLVTVWPVWVILVQVTFVPTLMVSVAGLKAKLPLLSVVMVTAWPLLAVVAVGVVPAVVAVGVFPVFDVNCRFLGIDRAKNDLKLLDKHVRCNTREGPGGDGVILARVGAWIYTHASEVLTDATPV